MQSIRFNPRLTSAARRTSGLLRSADRQCVSIRASLQQRGERVDTWRLVANINVSIRASLQQRGELRSPRGRRRARCFNPRLTSAARRTDSYADYDLDVKVSIRASLQQRGERNPRNRFSPGMRSFNPRLTSAARRTLQPAGCSTSIY